MKRQLPETDRVSGQFVDQGVSSERESWKMGEEEALRKGRRLIACSGWLLQLFFVDNRLLFKPTSPSVNYAKDWLDQLFLIPGPAWSGKGYDLCTKKLSLWDS